MNKSIVDEFWKEIQIKFEITFQEEDVRLLQNHFYIRQFKKNDYFIREGDESIQIAFVKKGLFRSYYIDSEGNDITKYFYAKCDLMFSYLAYISKEKSSYDIQAVEDSQVLIASIDDLEDIMKYNDTLLLSYRKVMDKILVMKEKHAVSFKMYNASERYLHFCSEFPELQKRIKQCHLASYLGITPVSLSRIKAKQNLNK